ncbi:MAG: cupin domain-containing protein [Deltaproteobacteria bacterium]|nr:MAG: cupin domain-containing protein [Deltaproteobacteria bacterium]
MARRGLGDELDDALEALMADPKGPLPGVSPRLAELLRIAGDLRGLPRAEFRAELKAALVSGAEGERSAATVSVGGRPLATLDDILARLEEMAHEPKMVAHDVRAALRDLPEKTMRFLASLNRCTLGVSRFSGDSHWERHPAGDEMLHILEGEAEVVTLTEAGPVRSTVSAGSVFVCRRGLWHRVLPRSPVSMLFATPGEGTEHSSAPDPRREAGRRRAHPHPGGEAPTLVAHDLRAALGGLPELAITSSTTAEEADAAVRTITALDQCMLGVMRYSGLTPWERHPDGDELLHVLEGEVDVTVLTDDGPAEVNVRAGSVFVCPRGLWHRQRPRPAVTMLFGTPVETEEVSWAEDPRTGG